MVRNVESDSSAAWLWTDDEQKPFSRALLGTARTATHQRQHQRQQNRICKYHKPSPGCSTDCMGDANKGVFLSSSDLKLTYISKWTLENKSTSTIQIGVFRLLFTIPTASPGQQGTKQSNIFKVSPFSFFLFSFCKTQMQNEARLPSATYVIPPDITGALQW